MPPDGGPSASRTMRSSISTSASPAAGRTAAGSATPTGTRPPLADGTYVYEFKIRDKSPQHNETGWSSEKSVTVSNTTGYHSYSIGQLAALPESALVTFDGKVTEVGKDFYTVTNGGASIKVMPSTKGSATDASLADKDVTVKGGTWIVSGEKRVTFADVTAK